MGKPRRTAMGGSSYRQSMRRLFGGWTVMQPHFNHGMRLKLFSYSERFAWLKRRRG